MAEKTLVISGVPKAARIADRIEQDGPNLIRRRVAVFNDPERDRSASVFPEILSRHGC